MPTATAALSRRPGDTLPSVQGAAVGGQDLVTAFMTGEPTSLREVYDRHQRMVHTFCRQAVGDHAADVTQEVFIAAWRSRDRFDPQSGTLSGWIMGIARHKVLDHLRSRYGKDSAVATGDVEVLLDVSDPGSAAMGRSPDASVEEAVDRMAERTLVDAALDQLGDPGGMLIRMAFLEGLSHSEIAERTGIPLGTTKSTIRRGLASLRQHLEALDVRP